MSEVFWREVCDYSYLDLKQKVIFIHIAKAGGTAVTQFFFKLENIDTFELSQNNLHPEIGPDQYVWSYRERLKSSMGNYSLSEKLRYLNDSNLRKITFIRQPIERFFSAWVSKILLAEPAYIKHRDLTINREDEIRIAKDPNPILIGELFEIFVDYFLENQELQQDGHFISQTKLLDGFFDRLEFHDVSMLNSIMVQLYPNFWEIESSRQNSTQSVFNKPICSLEAFNKLKSFYMDDFHSFFEFYENKYIESWAPEKKDWKFNFELYKIHNYGARKIVSYIREIETLNESINVLAELKNQNLMKSYQELSDKYEGLLNSTVWKMSLPVRKILSLLKSISHRLK
jgi:hypothetical protein